MDQSEAVSWWKKWFRIEKVETPSINLMNRSVVLKEVQLRLLIAEQALNQGKWLNIKMSCNSNAKTK
jgi:hypothetical protein